MLITKKAPSSATFVDAKTVLLSTEKVQSSATLAAANYILSTLNDLYA